MGRNKVKLKPNALGEVLRLDGVRSEVGRRAGNIARAAGAGYSSGAGQGRTRARGYVVAATAAARRDNAKNNTLVRALNAGRG